MVGDNGGGRGDIAGAQEGISGRRTGDGLLGGQAGGGLRCGRGRQWLTRWTAGSAAGGADGREAADGYQDFEAAKGGPGVLKQDVSSAWIC
jgi:hypothetical protein